MKAKTLYIVMADNGPDCSPSVHHVLTTRKRAEEVRDDLPGDGNYIEEFLASEIDAD